MITPPNLRDAIRSYLYVEFNADSDFASDLAAGQGSLDDSVKRELARIVATGEMDFDDFTQVTDNYAMEDQQVLDRLRRIWDTAFPDTDPRQLLQNADGA